MTFEEFSKTNLSRAQRWHKGGLKTWSMSDWAVALAGECGELCNIVKKLNRKRDSLQDNNPHDLKDLAEEIGDIQTYLDLFAQSAGISLEKATADKFNYISEREGFPERLTP